MSESQVMGVRLSREEAAKLEAIALLTSRSKGGVLKLLLSQAHLQQYPDVLLKETNVERLAERA